MEEPVTLNTVLLYYENYKCKADASLATREMEFFAPCPNSTTIFCAQLTVLSGIHPIAERLVWY